jgi:Transposase domain (DUF772)
MAGLAILKRTYNLSDEAVCALWIENPHYQYLCGEEFSSTSCRLCGWLTPVIIVKRSPAGRCCFMPSAGKPVCWPHRRDDHQQPPRPPPRPQGADAHRQLFRRIAKDCGAVDSARTLVGHVPDIRPGAQDRLLKTYYIRQSYHFNHGN